MCRKETSEVLETEAFRDTASDVDISAASTDATVTGQTRSIICACGRIVDHAADERSVFGPRSSVLGCPNSLVLFVSSLELDARHALTWMQKHDPRWLSQCSW